MTPHFLRANLCYMHGTMTASEGLLRAAIIKCRWGSRLGQYFLDHLEEEAGHLKMLEHDLWTLGVTRILKFPEAAQSAGAQYYYIEHEHPAMLLGYMAALECSPPTLEQVDALEAEHGPLTCTRHHAVHDIEHGKELRRQIEALPTELRKRVEENERFVLEDFRGRIIPLIDKASNYFLRH